MSRQFTSPSSEDAVAKPGKPAMRKPQGSSAATSRGLKREREEKDHQGENQAKQAKSVRRVEAPAKDYFIQMFGRNGIVSDTLSSCSRHSERAKPVYLRHPRRKLLKRVFLLQKRLTNLELVSMP